MAAQSARAVTIGDVATAAGVSRATVYRYFEGGRDEIILGVVLREGKAFLEALGRRVQREETLGSAIVEGVLYTVSAVRKNEHLALLFAPEVAGHTTSIAGASTALYELTQDFLRPIFEQARAAEAGFDGLGEPQFEGRRRLGQVGVGGRGGAQEQRVGGGRGGAKAGEEQDG